MPLPARAFLSELRRRKVYHVAVLYAVVGYGVAQGAQFVFELLELPNTASQVVAVVVVLGFPLALVLAWAYEVRPDPHGIRPAIPDLERDDQSIAVLPFQSLSSDPEGDYFADGISEELTNALARQPGLRVASRTSAFTFKREQSDVRDIGRRLHVSHVIEGSVRRSDQALRITAQLIDTRDGFHVWSDQFDRPLGDVFRIQEEIAGCVVRRLLGETPGQMQPSVPTADLSAYDEYLKGRQALAMFDAGSVEQAIHHFEAAIQRDHRFAPALAGLAEALTIQSIGFSYRPAREIMPRAADLTERALDEDPNLPEAHLGQALVHMYWTWRFQDAEASLARALELNPNFAEAHIWQEFLRTYVKCDFEGAMAANRTALELSPLDPRIASRYGTVLYLFGHLEEAEELFRTQIRARPDDPLLYVGLADTLVRADRVDEAVPHIETAVRLGGRPHAFLGMLCGFYGLQGNHSAAREILSEMEARQSAGYASGFWMAVAYAGAGRPDDSFAALDRAVSERDSNLLYLYFVPKALGLHEDPRFGETLERIGLGYLQAMG